MKDELQNLVVIERINKGELQNFVVKVKIINIGHQNFAVKVKIINIEHQNCDIKGKDIKLEIRGYVNKINIMRDEIQVPVVKIKISGLEHLIIIIYINSRDLNAVVINEKLIIDGDAIIISTVANLIFIEIVLVVTIKIYLIELIEEDIVINLIITVVITVKIIIDFLVKNEKIVIINISVLMMGAVIVLQINKIAIFTNFDNLDEVVISRRGVKNGLDFLEIEENDLIFIVKVNIDGNVKVIVMEIFVKLIY